MARQFLPFVRKPARYIGGEVNQSRKDLNRCDVRVVLCFPDIYEIGMSYLGLEVLYAVINGIDGAAAERVFAPWFEAEEVLRTRNIPLFTLESHSPVRDFDILGFSMTNELCYTNLLNMLDLAGLAVRAENRTENDPIVIVGGQAANSAEPISAFADMFVLGEGEEAAVKLIDLYRGIKAQSGTKQDYLLEAARQFDFVYVPQFYSVAENTANNGDTAGASRSGCITPKIEGLREHFHNAVVEDFENAPIPERPIVPFVQTVHDRVSIEIMRGCPGRCRFCQAGWCRRPVRVRSVGRIVAAAQKQYEATGHDTVSLLSLSTSDYPRLEELVEAMNAVFAPLHVGLSVPSLRVQKQLQLLPKMVASVRKGGLTIAVEAAGEKLRRAIGKPIADEDLFAAVRAAFEAGFLKVKLYFMVGFPGETEEDILGIADLSRAISALRREVDGKWADINAAVSWLVPKAHTPFGWLGQKNRAYFEQARRLILDRKRQLNLRYVKFNFHPIERSILESAIGRGDRRLCRAVETAWQNGAKFDLWDDGFKFALWQAAFAAAGLDLEQEAAKAFAPGGKTPWSHLGGPDEPHLLREYRQAMDTANT
ncbi:MAG: TIGR03960 family B12-binding radical SAM protein [Planctomycetales bacterium]|nr:TIGR03960 family B12-binding radical SAM protein [Planctomycetales bacterium]